MKKTSITDQFNAALSDVKSKFTKCYSKKNSKCCPDNYVGSFRLGKKQYNDLWFYAPKRCEHTDDVVLTDEKLELIFSDNGAKRIVIVLESPHVQEYDTNKYSVAPAPALGKTGQNLNEFFANLIKEPISNGKYHLFL